MHRRGGKYLVDVMADGVEEMSLAQAGSAVDEQRVVAVFSGFFADRQRGGVGKTVRRSDNEVVKGVFVLQVVDSTSGDLGGVGGGWNLRTVGRVDGGVEIEVPTAQVYDNILPEGFSGGVPDDISKALLNPVEMKLVGSHDGDGVAVTDLGTQRLQPAVPLQRRNPLLKRREETSSLRQGLSFHSASPFLNRYIHSSFHSLWKEPTAERTAADCWARAPQPSLWEVSRLRTRATASLT